MDTEVWRNVREWLVGWCARWVKKLVTGGISIAVVGEKEGHHRGGNVWMGVLGSVSVEEAIL